MFILRHLTAWLALVVAIAGPLPLWMHHAQCHTHAGLECTGHDDTNPSEGGGNAAPCHHHEDHCANAEALSVASSGTRSLTDVAEAATGQLAGYHGVTPEHDCFVCYQLSQAVASALVLSTHFVDLPPVASGDAADMFSIATLCGWHSPRGPPSA